MGQNSGVDGIGVTLGVEEEYHLVDPETSALMSRSSLADRALAGTAGPHLHAEMLTSQLEAVTDVCTDLEELRAALVHARRTAAEAAAAEGATILATSTHPSALLAEIEVMGQPRYERLVERFGAVVGQFNLCGCHVHVAVPDLDGAVAIMNHARPYLPLLAAITTSSPFHQGVDTGYESFRLAWLQLWPQGGLPPLLASADHYLSIVDQLTEIGLVDDASAVLWELRPSARYPTLEFRIADTCTDLDDAVLYAGLVRSLVCTLAARAAQGAAVPQLADHVLRALRWRAARFGLHNTLWSPSRAALVPARVAIDDLVEELRPDLQGRGEFVLVEKLLERLCARGTSSTWQRRTFAATGSLSAVVRAGVELTLRLD